MLRPARCFAAALSLLLVACKLVEPGPDDAQAPAVSEAAPEVEPGPPAEWLARTYKPVQDVACSLDAAGFAALYPAPKFVEKLGYKPAKARHLAKISAFAGLKPAHRAVLDRNGFVAVGGAPTQTFATTYLDIYKKDLPVMITADSLLYALHSSYDALLIDLEIHMMVPAAARMLTAMHRQLGRELGALPATLRPAALDLDVYLTIARTLIDGAPATPVSGDAGVKTSVASIAAAIAGLQPAELSLFGVTATHDMSQMRPRGHYADSPDMRRYFQAMIWLGRTELPMVTFDAMRKPRLNRRGLESAVLANLLLARSGAEADWQRIDDVLSLLVGEHDSMTPRSMQAYLADAQIADVPALVRASDEQLYGALMRKAYGLQRIMSQVIVRDPHQPQVALARVYQLMGQRFTLDSHVFNNVTYDRAIDLRTGAKATRMLPSELDVQFVLGNDAAVRHLRPELEKYGYQGMLHELRFLTDAHPRSFWDANLYNGWLSAIRALGDGQDFARWPEAMRTAAWADKTLNTQSASWAELRHDTLLYAKQSFSVSIGCEYPDAYVEPVPQFYARLGHIGVLGSAMVRRLEVDADPQAAAQLVRAGQYFARLSAAAGKLEGIARKELAAAPLAADETQFLKATIEQEMVGCGAVQYDGWYGGLFYSPGKIAEFAPTIADVHTAPTNERGDPVGHVLHAATSRPMLMVFTLADCHGVKAYVGPISSYHAVVTENFARKTDEEWAALLEQGHAARPAWTASFVR